MLVGEADVTSWWTVSDLGKAYINDEGNGRGTQSVPLSFGLTPSLPSVKVIRGVNTLTMRTIAGTFNPSPTGGS